MYISYLFKKKKTFKNDTTVHDGVALLFFVILFQAHKLRKEEPFFIFREKSQNNSVNLKELIPPPSSSVLLSPHRREKCRNPLDSAVWQGARATSSPSEWESHDVQLVWLL